MALEGTRVAGKQVAATAMATAAVINRGADAGAGCWRRPDWQAAGAHQRGQALDLDSLTLLNRDNH